MSAVILTQGRRPEQLAAAIGSVARQTGGAEVMVVWNGCVPPDSEHRAVACDRGIVVRDITIAENVGVPEGRNAAARQTNGTYLFFLDDDAEIVRDDTFAQLIARFEREPDVAVIGLRIVDEDGRTAQRHVPRLGRSSAGRSGEVTGFLGGVVAIRRSAFDDGGGYPGEFFYAMEESDLAWRLADAGWRIWYDADLRVLHPRTEPNRHPDAARLTARNRVWMVHRSLPAMLAVVYLFNWLVITGIRSPTRVGPTLLGYRTGWQTRLGPRRPISWSTVVRLSRLGRPPIL